MQEIPECREIPERMLWDYLMFKREWEKEGKPGKFYEWLLERLEKLGQTAA